MKRCASILIALVVTLSVVAPRRLDAMPPGEVMAQAMRCQSVLLSYSFFSVLPMKIISHMNTALPTPRAHAGASDAAGDTTGSDAAPAPFDISAPGSAAVSKTLAHKTILPFGDVISAGANHTAAGIVSLPAYSSEDRAVSLRHWMFMLPRGSIDDHILKIIEAVNKPIAACPRLAFSLGGNV